ncbi:hypothetical protein [Persicobacter sp. CCB-QB2]|uniref:hypothetical protein n=1 Tax=Persicobacter sp. CCB-QB2 TaxID=1561025 RepID=UPI0006A9957F|nr:hypothetical protein [Persicobacter sp. CCB-QB2]
MKRILDIIKHWGEYIPFLLAVVFWWLSRYVTTWLDPTAAVDDAGLLQAFLFKAMCYFGAVSFTWIALRLVFPRVLRYMDEDFGRPFDKPFHEDGISEYDPRLWLSICMLGLYLISAAIIFA